MLISHQVTKSSEFLNYKFSENMKQIHKIMDDFNHLLSRQKSEHNNQYVPISYQNPNRKQKHIFDQSTVNQTCQLLNQYAKEDEEFLKNTSRNLSENQSSISRGTKTRQFMNDDFPRVSSRLTFDSQNKQRLPQQKKPFNIFQDETINKTYQQYDDFRKQIQIIPSQNILHLDIDATNKQTSTSLKEQTTILQEKSPLTENIKLMSCAPSNKELLSKKNIEQQIQKNLLNTFNETQIHSCENKLSLDHSTKYLQSNDKKKNNKPLLLNIIQIKRTVRTQLETKPQCDDLWYKNAKKTDKSLCQQKSGKKNKIQCVQCDEFLQMGLSTVYCECRKKN